MAYFSHIGETLILEDPTMILHDLYVFSDVYLHSTRLFFTMTYLGYWHEQMRQDRDKYVKINWENILPGKENQFIKCNSCDNQGLKYEIGSIMHYHSTAFSKNKTDGLKTIVPVNGDHTSLGQRNGLSSLDIIGINKLYCPGYKAKCADNDESCPTMASDCEDDKKRNWMVKNCAGTCKVCVKEKCEDKYDTTISKPSCPGWAEYGFCETQRTWMEKFCSKACKLCS